MLIPGWLVALVTFPGVVVHEMGHQFFCRLYRLPVYSVCYFRIGNPAGYVVHEPAQNYGQAFWISVGPLVFNTLLTVVIGFPAAMSFYLPGAEQPLHWVLGWLAISIGMHAFPSSGDAKNLWRESKEALKKGNVAAVVGFPMVIAIGIANVLSVVWFDAFYAAGVMFLVPKFIIHLAARI